VSKFNAGSLLLRGILSVTKKQKHHLEGSAVPAGYYHMNAHYASGVSNYPNSKYTKYLAQV